MDTKRVMSFVESCTQDVKATCEQKCPLNMDIKGFINRIKKKDFNGAYKLMRNQVLFPSIVCEICDERCSEVCIRRECDDALSIRELEKACVNLATNKKPAKYNLPKKNKKIVIIGAGLAGMSCALRLASRNYEVVIYEKEEIIGGRLGEILSEDVYLQEFKWQTQLLSFSLITGKEIKSLNGLEFDAAFIATGYAKAGSGDVYRTDCVITERDSSENPGISVSVNLTGFDTKDTPEGVFLGDVYDDMSYIDSLEIGMRASDSIEKYLKTGSIEGYLSDRGKEIHELNVSLSEVGVNSRIIPKDLVYNEEEAASEASRCLQCKCEGCKTSCILLSYYNKMPKKLASDIIATLYPISTLSARIATRPVVLCNDCGACTEACPSDIQIGQMIMEAREHLHNDGTISQAFHEYWLNDMFHSFNEKSRLVSFAPSYNISRYIFFPGCQLGASYPEYVTKSYDYLRKQIPGIGIMLNCCGAPAHWAGDTKLHEKVIYELRETWNGMGKPIIITACATCSRMFRQYMPEIKIESLYSMIDSFGVPNRVNKQCDRKGYSIFDPCASRYDYEIQTAVRHLAMKVGLTTTESESQNDNAKCCGYGGNIYAAHPEYTLSISKKYGGSSENPLLTYCANCRDSFAYSGNRADHILDIIFDLPVDRDAPDLSQRRKNRELVKESIIHIKGISDRLKTPDWCQNDGSSKEILNYKELLITDEIRNKMNSMLIIEDDIIDCIGYCERTSEKLYDSKSRHFTGHLNKGALTYWVSYGIDSDRVVLYNVYLHRMTIGI